MIISLRSGDSINVDRDTTSYQIGSFQGAEFFDYFPVRKEEVSKQVPIVQVGEEVVVDGIHCNLKEVGEKLMLAPICKYGDSPNFHWNSELSNSNYKYKLYTVQDTTSAAMQKYIQMLSENIGIQLDFWQSAGKYTISCRPEDKDLVLRRLQELGITHKLIQESVKGGWSFWIRKRSDSN